MTWMQTITSLKLNFISFFIYCLWLNQNHERKMICHEIFLLTDRQWATEHQYLLICFLGVSLLQKTYNLPHLRLADMLTLVIALTPEAVYLTFQMSRHEKDGTWSNWHQAYYIILSRRKTYGRCMIWSLFIMKYLLVQYWLVHLHNSRRSGFTSLTEIAMRVNRGSSGWHHPLLVCILYMKQMGCRISTVLLICTLI